MLRDVLGFALISMGALTMIARVMARAAELRRRIPRDSFPLAVTAANPDPAPLRSRS
jgi:hypothetical protein